MVVVLMGLVLCLGCEQMESVATTYPNLDAARKASAVGEGKWIPEFLPASARNLRELHNLDTNESWLTFQIETDDLGPLAGSCKEATQSDVVRPRKSPGSWWPKTLVQSTGENNALRGLRFYRCVDGSEVAVDLERKEVFYWSTVARSVNKPAASLPRSSRPQLPAV
jgi:hypothetical protein